MISVTHRYRGYRYGSPIMLLSELGSAKLRIAYRYPYGTDNFVKFLKSHKNQSESFLRAAEKIT